MLKQLICKGRNGFGKRIDSSMVSVKQFKLQVILFPQNSTDQ